MVLPEIYSLGQLQQLRRQLARENSRRKREKQEIDERERQQHLRQDCSRNNAYGGPSEYTNKDRKRNLLADKKRYSKEIYAVGTVCVVIDCLPGHGDRFIHRTCVVDRVVRLSPKFDPNRTLYRVIILAHLPYFPDCVAIEVLDCQMVSMAEIQKHGGIYEVPCPKREFKPKTSYQGERPVYRSFPIAF